MESQTTTDKQHEMQTETKFGALEEEDEMRGEKIKEKEINNKIASNTIFKKGKLSWQFQFKEQGETGATGSISKFREKSKGQNSNKEKLGEQPRESG